MRYTFPRIEHINDVLPAIEGRDEFIVAKRDWGTVINYMVCMTDTFPPVDGDDFCPGCKEYKSERGNCGSQRCPDFVSAAAIRRECRGILFYPDGKIMARRLHKFFNVNERDETQHHLIDLSKPHVILEKLDGSMITPVVLSTIPEETMPNFGNDPDEQVMRVGEMRWGTKMGITDVAAGAEEFVKNHPNYEKFARWAMSMGFTPIFEWCSRKQKIVVDYPQDRLVLIAARSTVSGEYMSLNWMHHYAAMWDVEVVKTYPGTTSSMENLLSETREVEGQEGWIIRFNDGHMVKVKGDWYVLRHKSKDAITREKNVIDYVVNERVDDILPYLQVEDQSRLMRFQTEFWQGVSKVELTYEYYCKSINGMDRKEWAIKEMPKVKQSDPFLPAIVFGWYDNKPVRETLLNIIRKNIGTQTKINEHRDLWWKVQWSYDFDADV